MLLIHTLGNRPAPTFSADDAVRFGHFWIACVQRWKADTETASAAKRAIDAIQDAIEQAQQLLVSQRLNE